MHLDDSLITAIKRLVYRINTYAEMIYADALILDLTEFSDYWRTIVGHTSEIKRISSQAFPETPKDHIEQAIREEIARRTHIIRRMLNELPSIVSIEKFTQIQIDINTMSEYSKNLDTFFEKALNISTEHLRAVPLKDLQNASDYSLSSYLAGMSDRVKNASAGTIMFAGEMGKESKDIQNLLMNAAFHTVEVSEKETINDVIATYDVSLICYDCGEKTKKGFDTLQELIENPISADIPVLLCGSEYSELLAMQFISAGAIDYYSSPNSKRVLFARIQAAIIRARNNYHRQLYIRALEMNTYSTAKEFTAAAGYVADLLPKPFIKPELAVDWAFLPSLELGGDIFGYYWINENEFVIYLLDVSGHGLEASLYSVTVMNLLKNSLLCAVDFSNPSSVLTQLNKIFDIETQNNMFFTIWYGVYNCKTRELVYASAGSQPAIFIKNDTVKNLSSDGLIIGIDDETEYSNGSIIIEKESDLYVFSDGIYEIRKEDGQMMSLENFTELLITRNNNNNEKCIHFARNVEKLSKSGQFEDDVSLIHLHFS